MTAEDSATNDLNQLRATNDMNKLRAELQNAANEALSQLRGAEKWGRTLLVEIDEATDSGVLGKASSFRNQAEDFTRFCSTRLTTLMDSKATFRAKAFASDKVYGGTRFTALVEKEFKEAPWNGHVMNSIVLLSDLHEAIRNLEGKHNGQASGTSKWEAPSSFERSTTKYWVKEQELHKLLHACVEHVPLLIYGHSGRLTDHYNNDNDSLWADIASSITSIYFDSPKLSMYKDRITRFEGAQLFRVRWYGPKPTGDQPIFLELKTHHEKWIVDSSVKQRVTIKEKHMARFLEEDLWDSKDARPVVAASNPKLKGKELQQAAELLATMHNLVVNKGLRPCVRTVYSRVAFQSSSSNALRLTIDRDIQVSDETGAPQGCWCRPDDASSPPVFQRLPYPVFEVKLAGCEMPAGIASLIQDGSVQEKAKFSKFLTGVAVLHSNRVQTLPYWADDPAFKQLMLPNSSSRSSKSRNKNPVAPRDKAAKQAPICSKPSPDEISATTENSSNSSDSSMQRKGSSWFSLLRKRREPAVAAQRPARVEPKTYFANERTFIQWLSAALWLVTISALLLEKEAGTGVSHLTTTGIALSTGALTVVAYASFMYYRRIRLMQSGEPRGYVDHIAPMLLASSVIIGLCVLLAEKSSLKLSRMSSSQTAAVLREDAQCVLHANTGVSRLTYQPSDIAIDNERNMLLVPSLGRIIGHSKTDPNEAVKELLNVPGADMEGLVIAEGRIFALSEKDGQGSVAGLLELDWQDDKLVVLRVWNIDESPDTIGEGLAYFVDSNGIGSLCVEVPGAINLYDLPPPPPASGALSQQGPLIKKDSLNKKLLTDGLHDGRIGSMFAFRNVLWILHDNDGVLRSWDLAGGQMLAEAPLPEPGMQGSRKQWEGVAIEVNRGELPRSRLRGSSAELVSDDLILHLAMDTPPQVWSFAVKEGDTPGQIIFPPCAGVSQ